MPYFVFSRKVVFVPTFPTLFVVTHTNTCLRFQRLKESNINKVIINEPLYFYFLQCRFWEASFCYLSYSLQKGKFAHTITIHFVGCSFILYSVILMQMCQVTKSPLERSITYLTVYQSIEDVVRKRYTIGLTQRGNVYQHSSLIN